MNRVHGERYVATLRESDAVGLDQWVPRAVRVVTVRTEDCRISARYEVTLPAGVTAIFKIVNGEVSVKDVVLVAKHMGKKQGQRGYNPKYDLNGDRRINVKDLKIVMKQLGRRC